MAELRVLIVDDEPVARQVLADELAGMHDVEIVGQAENGEVANRLIDELAPDLVLLDIQMPSRDGFQVVSEIHSVLPAIVFVTAFDEHALRAFEVGAVDYLLKPVKPERLAQAVERARQRGPRENAQKIAGAINAAGRDSKIVARRGQGYYLLDPQEIYAFQAEGEIIWAVTEKIRFIATETLQALERRLSENRFVRVHRSALVNLDKIRKVDSLSSQRRLLTLENGLELPVSKRQAPLLRGLITRSHGTLHQRPDPD